MAITLSLRGLYVCRVYPAALARTVCTSGPQSVTVSELVRVSTAAPPARPPPLARCSERRGASQFSLSTAGGALAVYMLIDPVSVVGHPHVDAGQVGLGALDAV